MSSASDLSKVSGSANIESLLSTFITDGVLAGDTLHISGGSDTDYGLDIAVDGNNNVYDEAVDQINNQYRNDSE